MRTGRRAGTPGAVAVVSPVTRPLVSRGSGRAAAALPVGFARGPRRRVG